MWRGFARTTGRFAHHNRRLLQHACFVRPPQRRRVHASALTGFRNFNEGGHLGVRLSEPGVSGLKIHAHGWC